MSVATPESRSRERAASLPARRTIDIFCASFKRPEKLAAMIESVRAAASRPGSMHPARVIVAAGDEGTIQTCELFRPKASIKQVPDSPDASRFSVESVWCSAVNDRPGCTAPLNLAFRNAVRHDALFCTDDCVFEPDAFDIAMATLDTHFPNGDGVVGLAQENITGAYDLAFPLFGRAFLDRFRSLPDHFTSGIGAGQSGDLFWPGYFHLFNDAEIGLTIKCMSNWVFEPRARLRHYHPEFGGGDMDATHAHGLSRWSEDAQAWTARRARGVLWGLDEK